MKYDTFIWDFDGTLYDSYPPLAEVCTEYLHEHGIQDDYNEVLRVLKVTVAHFCDVYAGKLGISSAEMLENYRQIIREHPRDFAPYSGVKEMLASVTAHGGINLLYTHRGLDGLDFLRRDGLLPYFSGHITREDGFPLKPAPDALIHLINKYHLDRDRSVMIGDRDIDLLAAKGAGIRTCLFDPDHFYPDFKADDTFDSFEGMTRALTP